VVTDGEQALQFLHQTGEYTSAPRPGLVLLDLNLPRRSGHEVLAELKEDPQLRVIPVVILTTSQAEEDILRSYSLHANAYVSKPVDFERFMDVIRQIDSFFVTVVKLPHRLPGITWPAAAGGPAPHGQHHRGERLGTTVRSAAKYWC